MSARSGPVWQLEHSVETDATRAFAWTYWTDVTNWDDPPATFALDGAFAPGSHLITTMPGRESIRTLIREVGDGTATLEMTVADAVLSFAWRFTALPDGRTLITQRMTLDGPGAATVKDAVAGGFEPNIAPGMRRLGERIADAERSVGSGPQRTGAAPDR